LAGGTYKPATLQAEGVARDALCDGVTYNFFREGFDITLLTAAADGIEKVLGPLFSLQLAMPVVVKPRKQAH
jgi:hypothetical protein